jgi:YVTN family beta-propeller protein
MAHHIHLRRLAQHCIVLLVLGLSEQMLWAGSYLVCVSNERSGNITVIDGDRQAVIATVAVGKRPRGIHASPEGKLLYVALSGSPITGPPKLDAQGNPIPEEDEGEADHSADGIGVVDLE